MVLEIRKKARELRLIKMARLTTTMIILRSRKHRKEGKRKLKSIMPCLRRMQQWKKRWTLTDGIHNSVSPLVT